MKTFTRAQWHTLSRAREPLPMDAAICEELFPVSIQIVDAANPAARREVLERLRSLRIGSVNLSLVGEGDDDDTKRARKEGEEALKSHYHALTGYQMTDDELKEVLSD